MIIKVSDVMREVRNQFVRDALTGEFAQLAGVPTPAAGFVPGMWIAITSADGPICWTCGFSSPRMQAYA